MNSSHRASAFYLGTAGQAYHAGKRGVPEEAVPWISRARSELFQPHVRPTDAVLEWGCGAGWNLAALYAARRVGTDLEPALQDAVEATGAEFVGTSRILLDASFDVVISHHSLEHVAEPLAALDELHRLLRPGAKLLLSVPYETERRLRRYDPAEPNHHLFSWTPQTLGNLVALAGMRIESVGLRRYGYDRYAAAQAVRWRLGERGFRWLRILLRRLRPLAEVALVATRTAPDGPTLNIKEL